MHQIRLCLLLSLLVFSADRAAVMVINSGPGSVAIEPGNPTVNDDIRIVVSRSSPGLSDLSDKGSIQINGNLIKVMLVTREKIIQPGVLINLNLIVGIETYHIGKLPVGEYKIEVYLAVDRGAPLVYSKVRDLNFSVSGIAAVPASNPLGLLLLALSLIGVVFWRTRVTHAV